MEKKKNNKKKYLALLLALFVCAGGTMAWLTSTGELTNQFKVGNITDIITPDDTPDDDDGKGPDGTTDVTDDETKLNGNLYEPDWVNNSPISPGATVTKNPYVGIGPDSEDAFVFVMVKTNMKKVTFEINKQWTPVVYDETEEENGKYTEGLFKYNIVLEGNSNDNAWTATPLFENVKADSKATYKDLVGGKIAVQAYVHQANDGTGNPTLETDAENAAEAAYNSWDPFTSTGTGNDGQ